MKLKEQTINQCTRKVSIDIGPEEIQKGYQSYFNRIQKSVVLPGFRKGRAPLELVANHYREDAEKHVIEDLVSENSRKAIQELKLNPFGMPSFSDIEFTPAGLKFNMTVELKPEFDLKDYKGVKAKKKKVEVKAEEVKQEVEHLREYYATWKTVEDRAAKIGDLVVARVSCSVDGKVVIPEKEETYELDEKVILPEFVKQIAGMHLQEEKSFDMNYPEDYQHEAFRGKKGSFVVLLKEIKEKSLPEMNSEFLKTLGDFENLEKLESSISQDIEKAKEAEEKLRLEKELLDQICKKNQFDFPQSLVENRKEELFENQKRQFLSQGIPEDAIQKQEDKIREAAEKEAARQVHVAFILDRVSELEKIEVDETDLSERFYALAKKYRRKVEEVREYYEKRDLVAGLRAEIRSDKAIEFIYSQANFND